MPRLTYYKATRPDGTQADRPIGWVDPEPIERANKRRIEEFAEQSAKTFNELHGPAPEEPVEATTRDHSRFDLDAGDGITLSVYGDPNMTDESKDALREIGRAAIKKMDENQPVASEEDREVIRHLLRDGGNGVPAAGPLIRILTDSEALAQYAKERGE